MFLGMLLRFAECGYEAARLCMAVDKGHGNQCTGQLA